MDHIEAIEAALAEVPEEALKPWRQLDGMPYLHATDDPDAKPWQTPVVGRFDYLQTMRYIAACHPEAIRSLIARLREAEAALRALAAQPLTDEQLDTLRHQNSGLLDFVILREFRVIARAVERAHGIGGTNG